MENKVIDTREFAKGVACQNGNLYILTKVKELVEKDIAHSSIVGINKGLWFDVVNSAWDSTAIAVSEYPLEKLVFVGEDGDVCIYNSKSVTKEKISPKPKMIRNARSIEGYIFACGMHRQVFQLVEKNIWKDLSAPFPDVGEKVGFEDVDGFSLKELYAVGWNGEIWQFDGLTWVNRNSPTNLIMSSICCGQDGIVYIGGQQGSLIKGREDVWEMIEWEEETDVDIWDLCWFKGKLYVATMTDLFILDQNLLVPVDFGELYVPSCYNLTEAEGVMWSIGKDDVLSFDGDKWQQYE